ncbi:unnamed protein product [Linum tenue]|uniref:Uncharacterized protein n=2 Tax=Linum tenue TaxID=586396 RepID=A0AAV0QQJ4_9ROSI|nr:unnamed protein product [Linum tenue]
MAANGGELGIKVGRQKGANSWRWKVCRIRGVTKWERIKQAEARIRGLEAEIEVRNSEYEELKEKFEALELALECEKKKTKAEDEAKVLRRMSQELGSKVGKDWLSLEIRADDLQVDLQQDSGATSDILATSGSNLPSQFNPFIGGEMCGGISDRLARTQLFFKEENKNVREMAPSTPEDLKSSFPGSKLCTLSLSTGIEDEKSPEISLKSKINNHHYLDDGKKTCIASCPSGTAVKQEIVYKLQRDKDWESSWDLAADFEKDDMLCMMAVCTLYRMQTPDEREEGLTFHRNGRGFSQTHAPMGSEIAEFLTDEDPDGDMKRNVAELRAEFPDGVETCREIALYHARQLFEIYENEEDDLW